MPRKRRIIRKIYPETQQWFGEQMWPLVVAMFVLGGFLAGTVLAYLRLDTPYWYANAWTWLMAIPLVIAAALLGLAYTGNRLLRRTMQLALIVCMIFHLALFIVALETDVFRRVWMEVIADTEQVPEKRVVKVPVYSSLQHNSQEFAASDFERPVVTELPEPDAGRMARERLEHPPQTTHPQPISEPTPAVRPNLVRRDNPSQVMPRQDRAASQLSRKSGATPTRPNQEIQTPDVALDTSRRPTPQPADASVKRQTSPSTATRQPPSQSTPEVSQQPQPSQLTRQAADSKPQPDSPSATSLARRLARPAALPRSDAPADSVPSPAAPTRPAAIRPRPTSTDKRRTEAPQVERRINEIAEADHSIDRTPSRATAAQQPELSNPANIQTRRRDLRLARGNPSSPVADQPSNDPRPSTRSARQPPTAASLAVTKSNAGTAGSGMTQNLDRLERAPDKPATVASGSAKRAESLQNMPAGPALSPRDRALVRRDQAGRSQPRATLRATRLKLANLPGNREPSEMQASASASLNRAASDATQGPITAAKGSVSIDLGPTTIVAGSGTGKAAGGGQPKQSSGEQQEQVVRRQVAGTSVVPTTVDRSTASVPDINPTTQPAETSERVAPTADSGLAQRTAQDQSPDVAGPTVQPLPEDSTETNPSTAITRSRPTETALPASETVQRDSSTNLSRKMDRGPELQATPDVASIAMSQIPDPTNRKGLGSINVPDTAPTRREGGVSGPSQPEPTGAVAGPVLSEAPDGSAPGLGSMEREVSPSDQPGPLVRDTVQQGGPGKRLNQLRLHGAAAEVAVPTDAGQDNPARLPIEDSGLATRQPQVGPVRRSSGQSLPVEISADRGPGGLGETVSPEIGLARRRVSDDSPQLQLDTFRFARRDSGGLPDLSMAKPTAAEPYRRRAERTAGMGSQDNSPGPQTEEAIELGLVFLSRCQAADGAWRLDHFAPEDGLSQMASDTAATGLALLAFQGAGYHHRSHRYAEVVGRGIEFLVQNQQEDGNLFIPMDPASNRVVEFYSHGIAALALSEAFGMTQDPKLRQPAQKALDYIAKTQHPDRGGWRYTPQIGSDTSVTGWMVMALKSGELAELHVPAKTYAGIHNWLDQARASDSEPYRFRYNPYAPDTVAQRGGRRPSTTMTSVGLLMQLYLGWQRDHPLMAQGADVLLESLPAVGTPTNPQRDTYYWYYATQVMFHMGGRHWEAWNQKLHPLLINTQIREGDMAGSWDPNLPVRDRWAPHAGRIYVTTMNLLSLEVTYRYLPLYEETGH